MKNVFLIGAMKCGTNTLYHALKKHGKVAIPGTKELDYFLPGEREEPYSASFDLSKGAEVTLDGTTQYSKYPAIRLMPEAIHAMNPDARIVYLMRDPIARLESNIAHNIARGGGATMEDWRDSNVLKNALNFSRYYTQISLYTRLFPRENVFLGVFEEFVADQGAFLGKVCRFLDIDDAGLEVAEQVRNPRRVDHGADKLRFSTEEDARFAAELRPDIDCLRYAFDVDPATHWRRYEGALAHA